MIQTKKDLDEWHSDADPWKYEDTADDDKRKEVLLSEIPIRKYKCVLDIGCGQGFITRELPGEKVIGIDISSAAITKAKKYESDRINFVQGSLFELHKKFDHNCFDLIIITGVLYEQYIGNASILIYLIIDKLLKKDGILMSVHIDEWYQSRFPYLMLLEYFYNYREYTHRLEVYVK
jgi:2-polyprenyl-3-methyl-5-hydroxy-6-metoxy-1,4-benzoquinol methylase